MAVSEDDVSACIILPKKMWKELKIFAKKNDCSLSALVRRIIREWSK